MSNAIEKTIQFTYRPKRGTKSEPGGGENPTNAHLYRHRGYRRTYYGPGSDEGWDTLLYSLKQQTRLGNRAFEDEGQYEVQKLKDLFHLDAYQDLTVLNGLDVRGLQEYCGNHRVNILTAMVDCLFCFVLLVDKSVLEDKEKGLLVVKAVSLLWDKHHGWSG